MTAPARLTAERAFARRGLTGEPGVPPCFTPVVARKIPGLQRVLDAPALFSVAYGEVASSIYVALGIIALHALGLTPEVLALVGGGAGYVLGALLLAAGALRLYLSLRHG